MIIRLAFANRQDDACKVVKAFGCRLYRAELRTRASDGTASLACEGEPADRCNWITIVSQTDARDNWPGNNINALHPLSAAKADRSMNGNGRERRCNFPRTLKQASCANWIKPAHGGDVVRTELQWIGNALSTELATIKVNRPHGWPAFQLLVAGYSWTSKDAIVCLRPVESKHTAEGTDQMKTNLLQLLGAPRTPAVDKYQGVNNRA